jgi:hypothetical protein
MGTKPYFGQNKGVSFLWVVYKRGKDNKRFQGLKVSRSQGEKITKGFKVSRFRGAKGKR